MNLTRDGLSDSEEKRISAALGYGDTELTKALESLSSAAFEEYARMLLGEPIRSPEARSFRLLMLIKHVFDAIPPAARVCEIFGLSETQGKALIRDTIARYRFDLEETTNRGVKDVLKVPQVPGEDDGLSHVTMTVKAHALVDAMNSYLAGLPGSSGLVRPVRGRANAYEIDIASLKKLKAHFG